MNAIIINDQSKEEVSNISASTQLLILHDNNYYIKYYLYRFELSSNHDSAPDNKVLQGQFTDNFKYFCMKMYCQDSSNQGSQNMFFFHGVGVGVGWGGGNRIILILIWIS